MRYPNGMTAREWADATASPTDPTTLVQQQFANELDINTILRRFNVTGSAPLGIAAPVYGDFTGILDWEDAVEKVERAHADFMRLPPEVRERFQNDPGQLIEYARSHSYDQYLEESERLVAAKKVEPAPVVDDDTPA